MLAGKAAKAAASRMLVSVDREAHEIVIRKFIVKHIASHFLQKKFLGTATIKDVNSKGMIIEHRDIGEVLFDPSSLAMRQNEVTIRYDLKLLKDGKRGDKVDKLISGILESACGGLVMIVSGGMLGTTATVKGVVQTSMAGFALIQKPAYDFCGRNREQKFDIPSEMKNNKTFNKQLSAMGGRFECQFSTRSEGLGIGINQLTTSQLDDMKTRLTTGLKEWWTEGD